MIPLCFLDGLEVGRSRRPCGGEEGGIEAVTLRGAESGVVALPER